MQSRLAACAKKRSHLHGSIVDTIGRTPIVQLQNMVAGGPENENGASVHVKLECENPGGSVKDRLAVGVIEWAEAHHHIQPGQTVVEASSGNTGIGLALVCAARGYPLVCVMVCVVLCALRVIVGEDLCVVEAYLAS